MLRAANSAFMWESVVVAAGSVAQMQRGRGAVVRGGLWCVSVRVYEMIEQEAGNLGAGRGGSGAFRGCKNASSKPGGGGGTLEGRTACGPGFVGA
jgi:hypothetical protein